MKRDEFKVLNAAQETFIAMLEMMDYEEAHFNGIICAMIETYAETHNIDKFELTAKIYLNLRTNDHE